MSVYLEEVLMTDTKGQLIIDKLIQNVEKVIVGKRDVIEKTLIALLAKGHLLLEDVPGVGKTMMVRALAKSIGGRFKRVQFTPDLLPSDIVGVSIYNQKTMEFEFKPGPLMTNILLADEINRTSPKSQSALLESMEEGSITVDGTTYHLERPFLVMATQNPIEYEGTFPLPEAQMDRFMLKINLGYPEKQHEVEILSRLTKTLTINSLEPVCTMEDIISIQDEVAQVYVDGTVKEYIVDLCRCTREHPDIMLGVSPRAAISLYRAGQAKAYLMHRDFVKPDDVKELAVNVLAHRIILHPEARMDDKLAEDIIRAMIAEVAVPVSKGKDLA
jgi:MoxR-like ATPase